MKKFLLLIIICIILSPLLTLANADLNNDGNIDISDLVIVASDFGKSSGYNQAVDTDSNNVIDIFDIVYIASRFGTTPPEPPEPPPTGKVIYAASLSRDDIQAAVDAAEAGDTVVLPAGTNNDFKGTVTVNKGITIYGAGKTSTVLKRASSPGNVAIFHVDPFSSENETFSFHDIGLWGYGHTDDNVRDYGLFFDYSGDDEKEFQITVYNCEFNEFGHAGVKTNGYWYGVIWDCNFEDNDKSGYGYGVAIDYCTSNADGGQNSWDKGNVNIPAFNLYIEDCTGARNRHFVSGGRGARYVVRYNYIVDDWENAATIDAGHGYNEITGERGTLWSEVYNNTMTAIGTSNIGIHRGGGSGCIYNNTATNAGSASYLHVSIPNGAEDDEYPYPDQVNNAYYWNNWKNGNSWHPYVVLGWKETFLQEDRDYYQYEKPRYVPYPYPHPLRAGVADNIVFAASLSRDDIQTAVASAEIGDIVVLPAGTNNDFIGTVSVPAGVEIKGQGSDKTILKRSSLDNYNPFFEFDCSNGEEVKFSEIKLQATYNQNGTERGLLLENECYNFRVWNSEFEGFSYYAVYLPHYSTGVIWNCSFKNNYRPGYGYGVMVAGTKLSDTDKWGDYSWSHPLNLGTDQFVFIEDCFFSNNRHSVVSSAKGARYVVRYNTFIGNASMGSVLNTHGPGGSGRGHRAFEVYNNTCKLYQPQWGFIGSYTGDGVVYNNKVNGTNYQLPWPSTPWAMISHPCCGAGTCGEYPYDDQTTSLYLWGNILDGVPNNYIRQNSNCPTNPDMHQEGRDFFRDTVMSGYAPYPYPHLLRAGISQ